MTKQVIRQLCNGLLLGSLLLMMPSAVTADSYQVNASVPYKPPTVAAVFTSPAADSRLQSALAIVSGSCQLMTPQTIVAIYRGVTLLGSTSCDGTFSVAVQLAAGSNTLIAKTYNVSGLYGPDSPPLHVMLTLPASAQAAAPASDTSAETAEPAAVPAAEQRADNNGAASGLTITPAQAFSTLSAGNTVSLTVAVGGGTNPYDVQINWGDGSTDAKKVDHPGGYTFDHTYLRGGNYKVRGKVSDVLGAQTEFQYAVVAIPLVPATQPQPARLVTVSKASGGWPIPVTVAAGALALIGCSYWLGWHVALRRLAALRRQSWQKRRRR